MYIHVLTNATGQSLREMHFPDFKYTFRIIPRRHQDSGIDVKLKPYSPFRVSFKSNTAEYALARVDDLVNWSLKVQ